MAHGGYLTLAFGVRVMELGDQRFPCHDILGRQQMGYALADLPETGKVAGYDRDAEAQGFGHGKTESFGKRRHQ